MVSEKRGLEQKVAIITGGGTGLGKAMALALAKEGADIVIAARRVEPIEQTAKEVSELGRRVLAIPTDVTDSQQVNRMVERTLSEMGRIDILINNAGGGGVRKPIWDITDEEWHRGMDTNLSSAFFCCRAVSKHLVAQKSGKVINIASGWGFRGMRDGYMYCCGKGGIIQLTRVLAITWAQDNIQVNCIAPGLIDSGHLPPERKAAAAAFTPVGRVGEVPDIGSLGLFLASDASNYTTGEVFLCDGAALAGAHVPYGYAPIITIKEE